MKRSLALAASTIALAAVAGSPALAQDQGPYVAFGGGYVMPKDSEVDLTGPAAGADAEVEWDNGWAAMLAGGYAWGNGLRTELEMSYRDNGVDTITPNAGLTSDGSVNALSFMANALYEFDFGIGLKPYLGAGIGVARVEMEDVGFAGTPLVEDGDTSWAWQGIAGAAYGVSDNVDLTLDYRYFSAPDVELSSAVPGVGVETDYENHTVMVGLRYTFGAPPPPPPAAAPAPAPQPEPVAQRPAPRDYLVFFEFDRANLTPEAQSVLNQAAAATAAGRPANINVTGHADRSGSDDYNMRLSMRRADSVANYLQAQGVPAGAIDVSAEGETQPLVPTADGVREPQNRRVTINVQ